MRAKSKPAPLPSFLRSKGITHPTNNDDDNNKITEEEEEKEKNQAELLMELAEEYIDLLFKDQYGEGSHAS